MTEYIVVTDLQFGSTGKGLLCGHLARISQATATVTAWAPNAGHTFQDDDGARLVTTMLASSVMANRPRGAHGWRPTLQKVMIGPGSVINVDALIAEIEAASSIGCVLDAVTIYIHGNAAVVQSRHRERERVYNRIGSTSKGSGAALIEKIERDPAIRIVASDLLPHAGRLGGVPYRIVDNTEWYGLLGSSPVVIVEGAQGYSLSLSHGTWPYVTSRDCTTNRILADCGVPPSHNMSVWGVIRSFPIRVANRHNENGGGTSGPCYDDQHEIMWGALGLPAELTTVTKLERRLFTFSSKQYEEALFINGVDHVFANFMNYLPAEQMRIIDVAGNEVIIPSHDTFHDLVVHGAQRKGASVDYLGYGPGVDRIVPSTR
jgi:adenylosuccinate synthase